MNQSERSRVRLPRGHREGKGLVGGRASGLLVLLSMVGLASCGSTSTGSANQATNSGTASSLPSGIAHATANLAQYTGVPSGWKAPGPSIDASSLKGKTVWYIPVLLAIPYFHAISLGLSQALAHANVKVQICNGAGTPAGVSSCINEAVAEHGAGIIMDGLDPTAVKVALQSASQAGIPYIVASYQYPAPSTDKVAYSSIGYVESGRLMADWIIKDSGAKANILLAATTDSDNTPEVVDQGFLPEIQKYCPRCSVTQIGVTAAQWSTRLGPETSTALLAHPNIDYFAPQYDGMAPYMVSAAQLSGHSNIKVSTFNGDLAQMQSLAKNQSIGMDVGWNLNFYGWLDADQMMRMMLHVAPFQQYTVPARVFTSANIGGLALTTEAFNSGAWYGGVGYQAKFLKLWQLP